MHETKEKPNCYKCVYRGTLAGDYHSRCAHPSVRDVEVTGNPHGIKNGWFNWPYNFDPVWLETCNGFEGKDGE